MERLRKLLPQPKQQQQQSAHIYPIQHPRNLDQEDTQIIRQDRPRLLTRVREIPYELAVQQYEQFESPQNSRSMDICILGEPNAGKSRLMNKLVGKYVSAVSNKSNTTEDQVIGIYTNIHNSTQLVYSDTPGATKKYKNTDQLVTKAWSILQDMDLALYVVDSVKRISDNTRSAIIRLCNTTVNQNTQDIQDIQDIQDTQDTYIQQQQKDTCKLSSILILNKIDLCNHKRKLKELKDELIDLGNFDKVFYTSAETGYGINELIQYLETRAHRKSWKYPPHLSTDQSTVNLLEEIIKGFIYQRYYNEIPFLTGNKIVEFVVRTDKTILAKAKIDVENENQKRIIIGHQGRNLEFLKQHVKAEFMKLFNQNLELKLEVYKRDSPLWKENVQQDSVFPPGYSQEVEQVEYDRIKQQATQQAVEAIKKLRNI